MIENLYLASFIWLEYEINPIERKEKRLILADSEEEAIRKLLKEYNSEHDETWVDEETISITSVIK